MCSPFTILDMDSEFHTEKFYGKAKDHGLWMRREKDLTAGIEIPIPKSKYQQHALNCWTKVNLETDMFARYIFNMFKKDDKKDKMTWDQVDKIMATY